MEGKDKAAEASSGGFGVLGVYVEMYASRLNKIRVGVSEIEFKDPGSGNKFRAASSSEVPADAR